MKLTNKSRQILLNIVKEEINTQEYMIVWLKLKCSKYYTLADKAYPEETLKSFESLNEYRKMLKDATRRVKKLSQVSKELKLDMKSGIVRQSKKHDKVSTD